MYKKTNYCFPSSFVFIFTKNVLVEVFEELNFSPNHGARVKIVICFKASFLPKLNKTKLNSIRDKSEYRKNTKRKTENYRLAP